VGLPAENAASQEGAMAEENTKESGIDCAFHRREATRLRDLSIHQIIARSLHRLRPRPIAWSAVAALIAAGIGWMAIERAQVGGRGVGRPASTGFAPASLPIPADLGNANYDSN
jgi:hypothetical protein